MSHAYRLMIQCNNTGCPAVHDQPVEVARTAALHAKGQKAQLANLRVAAAEAGWSRFRAANADSLGDYCPACTKKLIGKPL